MGFMDTASVAQPSLVIAPIAKAVLQDVELVLGMTCSGLGSAANQFAKSPLARRLSRRQLNSVTKKLRCLGETAAMERHFTTFGGQAWHRKLKDLLSHCSVDPVYSSDPWSKCVRHGKDPDPEPDSEHQVLVFEPEVIDWYDSDSSQQGRVGIDRLWPALGAPATAFFNLYEDDSSEAALVEGDDDDIANAYRDVLLAVQDNAATLAGRVSECCPHNVISAQEETTSMNVLAVTTDVNPDYGFELELEEYYGIALSDGHAQTEHCIAEHGTQTDNTVLSTWEPLNESLADDFLRDLSSQVLGFEFVQMQAINNIFTCKDIGREVLESAPTSDDSGISGHGARTWDYELSVDDCDISDLKQRGEVISSQLQAFNLQTQQLILAVEDAIDMAIELDEFVPFVQVSPEGDWLFTEMAVQVFFTFFPNRQV